MDVGVQGLEGLAGPALRVAFCEDNPVDTELLTALIEITGLPHTLDRFVSGEAFLESFEKDKYNLIFLDVYMGRLTGVQTAELIREIDTQVVIVFITTSEDFTREGYRLNAYKYLLKPITTKDIVDALELATLKRNGARGATLTIVTDNIPVIIPLNDILYIESRNRQSLINTTDETYATNMTLDVLMKLLPSPRFLPSHRSFIVNLDHVDELQEDFIMDNGEIAYITVKNYRKVKKAYESYLAGKA